MDSSRKVLAMNPIMIRIKTKKQTDSGQKVEETIARKVAPMVQRFCHRPQHSDIINCQHIKMTHIVSYHRIFLLLGYCQ